jgi:hypothetical protein
MRCHQKGIIKGSVVKARAMKAAAAAIELLRYFIMNMHAYAKYEETDRLCASILI